MNKCFFTVRNILPIATIAAVLSPTCLSANAYTLLPDPNSFSENKITLDFEGLPIGTPITTQFQNLGVVFSSVNGIGTPIIDFNEVGDGQGINGGPGDPSIYTFINQDAPLLVTFVDPVTGNPSGVTAAAGGFYVDLEPLIGQGFFFDVNGNQIARFVLDQEIDFWGLRADPGDALIGSILFDSTGGYPEQPFFGKDVSESYTVDNLMFEPVSATTTAVPEPSSVMSLILMSGLGASSLLKRKMKTQRRVIN
jgi:hypothetical protein